jgi:uncharacterized RDD family membrane protein YckC
MYVAGVAAERGVARATRPGRYQTFWRRFFAAIIDGVVVVIVTWPLDSEYFPTGPWTTILATLAITAISVAYYVLFHARRGQTPGKMLTRVRVMDLGEARTPTLREATLRSTPEIVMDLVFLALMLPSIATGSQDTGAGEEFYPFWMGFAIVAIVWWSAEIIAALVTAKRRALHDFIAGTVVVRVERGS